MADQTSSESYIMPFKLENEAGVTFVHLHTGFEQCTHGKSVSKEELHALNRQSRDLLGRADRLYLYELEDPKVKIPHHISDTVFVSKLVACLGC